MFCVMANTRGIRHNWHLGPRELLWQWSYQDKGMSKLLYTLRERENTGTLHSLQNLLRSLFWAKHCFFACHHKDIWYYTFTLHENHLVYNSFRLQQLGYNNTDTRISAINIVLMALYIYRCKTSHTISVSLHLYSHISYSSSVPDFGDSGELIKPTWFGRMSATSSVCVLHSADFLKSLNDKRTQMNTLNLSVTSP